ncbi:MAG: protein translocase subunit SecD [Acetobacteraceae bacterium]|nr:protein translocase subunit SecD [Acetobacteraceae bacterium]MSP30252.1 protein translocase subunit SecD [Acetobacteraceae bacterium]
MMYFTRLKTAVILGVCLLGAILCIPNIVATPTSWLPWRYVHLGLDLRGGSYLLLEVDTRAVTKDRLEGMVDGVRQILSGKFQYTDLAARVDQNQVRVRLRDPTKLQDALTALRPMATTDMLAAPEIELAGTPDGLIALTLSPLGLRNRATQAIQQSIEIVRRRIDASGVVDPQITRQGESRIVVQLPGIEDPNRIKELLGKTARMTFRLVDVTANAGSPAPPGVEFLPMDNNPNERIAVRRRIEVDGGDLKRASAGVDSQNSQWVVNFEFNQVGARRFAEVSRTNVGRPFAIVLDDKVISAPRINEPITGGRGQISGSFNAQSATDLAVLLQAGALPAPLTVVEERSVGPELGADAIRAGAISLFAGFLFVCAYMGIFYGLFGWIACGVLVVNLWLMMAILSLLEATMTLPGMAGILLTLGVAVDSNILINERIREETLNGRAPLQALEAGFSRAFNTIFDSNATGFLSHVMLFAFGAGPVRGFAITITVGIATTLFTNWLLTRLIISRWYVVTRPRALPV